MGAAGRDAPGASADAESPAPALAQPWPARIDPFYAFASYPTALLTPQTVLGLVDADVHTAFARVGAYRQLAMVNFAQVVLPTDAEVQAVLQAAASPRPAMELVQAIPAERQAFVFRALVWLVKLNILKVCA